VAQRLERPVKLLSVTVLAIIIVVAIIAERENILVYLLAVGLLVFIINVLSLGVGYGVPLLLGVEHRAAIATGFEVGIHNSALALTVAINVLGSTIIAIPAAVYSIIMYFTAVGFGYLTVLARQLSLDDPARARSPL
jgi:BASS family bile acid:Na+ symporter